MKKTKVTFNNEHLQLAVDILRALAHPLRLKILEFIDNSGETNVNRIYHSLDIEQSLTSQHLGVMKRAGIVHASKDGKFVHYKIDYKIVEKAEKAINNFLAAEKR